ncbi:5'/3'-nucleotidase SurE [Ramlibacter sp.]|uniref:5'/3'-nucleotidase SurE n=1 Tax=Ramlibacter sp. TaxID=1917967 RepID=UPI003D1386CE
MRILITNDDGIQAPGLPILARCLADAGHDVVVAAPTEAHSGCGASIGSVSEAHRIRVDMVHLPGVEELTTCSVDSPPAFIVLAALQGMFGTPPDVVVTGPNAGFNLGPLVLHSGTLGAAVTAASKGVPAIALSTEKRARFGYRSAGEFCARHLHGLLDAMGPGVALNVNVPDLPSDRLAGVRQTRLSPHSLVAIVLHDDDAPGDGDVLRRMRIELDHDADGSLHRQRRAGMQDPDDTDAGAIVDGFVSVTVMHGGLLHVDGRDVSAAWTA